MLYITLSKYSKFCSFRCAFQISTTHKFCRGTELNCDYRLKGQHKTTDGELNSTAIIDYRVNIKQPTETEQQQEPEVRLLSFEVCYVPCVEGNW